MTVTRSFDTLDPATSGSARGAHFAAEVLPVGTDPVEISCDDETMVLLLDVGATIDGTAPTCDAPARAVCILPPGQHVVRRAAPGTCVVLRGDPEPAADRDPRLVMPVPHRRRDDNGTVRVHAVDNLPLTGASGRLRMLQSSTLSINWVEYDGPRDRSTLSPHSHRDFEQGSLALRGDFVHHLRTPWGPDADRWQDDEHLAASSPSLLVIPAEVEHTSEGVGNGPHLLIDVFSPPRADFIAKGMVANAGDYVAD